MFLCACARDDLAGGVRDSTFVAAMAELQRIDDDGALDSAGRATARAAVLQRRGLTRAQLERASASLAGDPERALTVYRAIEQRARAVPAPAGRPPATPAGSAPPVVLPGANPGAAASGAGDSAVRRKVPTGFPFRRKLARDTLRR